MKANDKIYVAKYLEILNKRVEYAIKRGYINKEYVNPITCKQLADYCDVTPATITNLTTSSKFYLLYRVAEEILDAYYGYFMYDEAQDREDHPDECIRPRDKNYILMEIVSYYTNEWING